MSLSIVSLDRDAVVSSKRPRGNSGGGNPTRPKAAEFSFWAAVVVAVGLMAWNISRSSLWIDEGFTAWLVGQRSFSSLVGTLLNSHTIPSDRQYPLYVLYIWAWCKFFGTSEVALRSANLPFAAMSVISIAVAYRIMFARLFGWLPFVFAPLFWLYLSEARQYSMLMSFATIAVAATMVYAFGSPQQSKSATWFVLVGFLLTMMSDILGAFVVPGMAIILVAGKKITLKSAFAEWRVPLLVMGPAFLLVAAYYAWTLSGSDVSQELQYHAGSYSGAEYAGYALYETSGFDGLGPPRNVLREKPLKIPAAYMLPLSLGVLLLGFALARSLTSKVDSRFRITLLSWILSFIVAFAISCVMNTPLLGRYVSATLPLFLFALMLLIRSRVPLAIFAVFVCVSDARLTLLADYAKDDYRSAVAYTEARVLVAPGAIDWVADWYSARYYGLYLASFPTDASRDSYNVSALPAIEVGKNAANLRSDQIDHLLYEQLTSHRRAYVVYSKPDLYDKNGAWHAAIVSRGARLLAEFNAISIYEFTRGERR